MKYALIVALAIFLVCGCSDKEPVSGDTSKRVDGQTSTINSNSESLKKAKREKSLNEFNEKMKMMEAMTPEEAEAFIKNSNHGK